MEAHCTQMEDSEKSLPEHGTDAMHVFLLRSVINLSHFRTEDQPAKMAIFVFYCFDVSNDFFLLQSLTKVLTFHLGFFAHTINQKLCK